MKTLLFALLLLSSQNFLIRAPEGYEEYESWINSAGSLRLASMEEEFNVRLPRPVRVTLLPSDGGSLPSWADGWASRGNITVRIRSFRRFPEVFTHEIAHGLIWRASRNRPLPRWFEEGLAMHLAGEQGVLLARVSLSLQGGAHLLDLETSFPTREREVRKAYAKSYLAVNTLKRRIGMDGIKTILVEVGEGRRFDDILLAVSGMNVPGLEEMVTRKMKWSYVYLPLITSSSFLWLALTLLFIVVYIRKRSHNREVMASWEEEDNDPDVPCQ